MPRFCTKCGEKLKEDFVFCGECGTKVENSSSSSPINRAVSPPPAKASKPLWSSSASQSTSSIPKKTAPKKDDVLWRAKSTPKETKPLPVSSKSSSNVLWSISRSPNKEQSKPSKEPTFPKETKSVPSTPRPAPTVPKATPTVKAPTVPNESASVKPQPTASAPAEPKKDRKKEQAEEEEYMKNKETSRQLQDYQQRKKLQSHMNRTIDPVTCNCEIRVETFEIRMKDGKPDYVVYQIRVAWADTRWEIFRRFSQVTALDSVFRREMKRFPGLPVVTEAKASKFDPSFLALRVGALSQFFQTVTASRRELFDTKRAPSAFFKFIAPFQMGDSKPTGFVMPFKVDL